MILRNVWELTSIMNNQFKVIGYPKLSFNSNQGKTSSWAAFDYKLCAFFRKSKTRVSSKFIRIAVDINSNQKVLTLRIVLRRRRLEIREEQLRYLEETEMLSLCEATKLISIWGLAEVKDCTRSVVIWKIEFGDKLDLSMSNSRREWREFGLNYCSGMNRFKLDYTRRVLHDGIVLS